MVKYALVFFLVAGAALAPRAQETLSSVQRELDRVDKEIEREKELHKTERKRAADYETEKAAKMKALQEQLRLTGNRIDSLKHQLDRARQQKASFKGQATLYQAKQKEFVKALTGKIRETSAVMKKDFPYQKEKRATELEELATAIESGVVTVEDGIGRFFTLLQSSLDFAYDTEVYRGTYQAGDGSSHEGNYVRLGSVLLAFAGEDGQYAAYLTKPDSGYAWVDKDLPDALRRDVLTAAQVAQGKVAPQLVNLPFLAPKVKEAGQ